jgi:AcrR family transcriptional regulator
LPHFLTDGEIDAFRDRLCRVATRLFAEHGYPGVTLRAIAREVGCSPMTPYRYFAGKQEIFAAVRASAFARFADACEAAVASADAPLDRLAALGGTYLAFAKREPHAYRIMFELWQPDQLAFPELAKQVRRARQVKLDAVDAALRAGLIQGDREEVAGLIWAGVHGVVALHLAGKLSQAAGFDALAPAMIETLIRGLVPRSQPEDTR